MTDTANTSDTAEASKRNAGPMAIDFINDANEASTRVPSKVMALRVVERATNKAVTFNLAELPTEVVHQLAAAGAKKLIETLCRNNADEHGTNIIDSANTMFATLKAGKLYTRGGSTADGVKVKADKFDYGFYLDVVKVYTLARTGKAATQESLDKFQTKLASATPVERKAMIKAYAENKAFNAALLQVKAARAAAAARSASSDDNSADAELDII